MGFIKISCILVARKNTEFGQGIAFGNEAFAMSQKSFFLSLREIA
jgi:hypothetical protein